jgi:hypothetical protein
MSSSNEKPGSWWNFTSYFKSNQNPKSTPPNNEKSESWWNFISYFKSNQNPKSTPPNNEKPESWWNFTRYLKRNQNPERTPPNNEQQENPNPSLPKKIGKALLISGGVAAGASAAPWLLGFGTAGVKAGSIAASVQSGIGNVAAGSMFSSATSLGMKGFFMKGVFGGGATAAAGGVLTKNGGNKKEKESKNDQTRKSRFWFF